MEPTRKTTGPQARQLAALIFGGLVTFNTAFFFLSSVYYADRADGAAMLGHVRIAFAVLTVVVGAMAYTASLAPRLIGHGLAVVLGLATVAGGVAAFARGMPPVMSVTLLAIGALMPMLAWRSLHHLRGAWAFLISLLAVFAAVTFFGAPKIRVLLGVGLWTAMILPGLQIIAVVALAMVRGEYGEARAAAPRG